MGRDCRWKCYLALGQHLSEVFSWLPLQWGLSNLVIISMLIPRALLRGGRVLLVVSVRVSRCPVCSKSVRAREPTAQLWLAVKQAEASSGEAASTEPGAVQRGCWSSWLCLRSSLEKTSVNENTGSRDIFDLQKAGSPPVFMGLSSTSIPLSS